MMRIKCCVYQEQLPEPTGDGIRQFVDGAGVCGRHAGGGGQAAPCSQDAPVRLQSLLQGAPQGETQGLFLCWSYL